MKKYEIMYIVNASLDEATRKEVMTGLETIITVNNGSIDNVDDMGIQAFAYEINKMTKGHYVVMNVSATNEGVAEFDRLTRINTNVVRFMMLKLEDAK